MELRIFQIVVPVVSLLFILNLGRNFHKSRITTYELVLGALFWISVAVFAVFPDKISDWIARIFGVKSNVNAIIFLCIGLLFFFQFRLYFLMKKQQQSLTELVRKLAIDKYKEEEKV